MKRKERYSRFLGLVIGEILAVGTLTGMIVTRQYSRIPLAAATLLLVLLPEILERLCRCRFSLMLYLFSIAYALGPMLGQCWNFYYTVLWWDKLLHISGGVLFAIAGVYLYQRLQPERQSPLMAALFGLLLSMAVAVVWELLEFGADRFLGMDMQDDMLITGLCSYLLGDRVGQTGSIGKITSVLVNGIPLPGYIDIGLIDTMLDLLLETAGAGITCLWLLLDKEKHPPIQKRAEERKEEKDE